MLGIAPTEKTIILLQSLQYKEIILKRKEKKKEKGEKGGTRGKGRKGEKKKEKNFSEVQFNQPGKMN